MTFCLTTIERNGKVATTVFDQDEVTIGRSSTNDIRLDPVAYTQVSRRHARIVRVKADTYTFEDFESTHGSWFEGKQIKAKMSLQRGDLITLGRDGPMVSVNWPQDRITGHEGTHLRLHRKPSANFPLVFSEGFLDRFKTYDKIAAGGFGEVWRGHPIDGAPGVAIKLMHPDLLDPENLQRSDRDSLIRRFSREAWITHQLSLSGAPSIVKVHSWGDDPDRDYLYIIMDMIEGLSLDKIIFKHQVMPQDSIARYMMHVALGLDAAHSFEFEDEAGKPCKGIVHRDIKPNNLLVDYTTDTCWIVDFGVAGIQEGGERLTATNITVGTYQFLPLESIEDNIITPHTDLWGFCVTMYLAFSRGRFPYAGRQRSELAQAIRNGELIPISAYRNDIDPAIVDALARSLHPDPTRRIQSAAEWAELLGRFAGPARPMEPPAPPPTA